MDKQSFGYAQEPSRRRAHEQSELTEPQASS